MASNQFLAFAEGGSANTLTPTAYAALATLIANGYQTGVADSQQINTTLRQSSFMAAVIGQIVADAGNDALDNGDIATFKNNLIAALRNPIGTPILCPTASAPTGYLLCNGATVSRTAYAALFAVIGTTFGAGDGSTTFNLPDCRNRMTIGSGSLYAIGNTGGNKDQSVVSHNHSLSLSGTASSTGSDHTHTVMFANAGTDSGPDETLHNFRGGIDTAITTGNPRGTPEGAHTHSVSISGNTDTTGSSGVNANLPPYIAFNVAIKY